jgi:hypothetical protein
VYPPGLPVEVEDLVLVGKNRYGWDVVQYIETHSDRRPEWVREYTGLARWMDEDHPGRGSIPCVLAAEAVCLWIVYRDLERLSIDEYRTRLANLWEDLRGTPPAARK